MIATIARRLAFPALLPCLFVAAACSSTVTRHEEAALAMPHFAEPGKKAGNVSLALTPEAQKMAADNLKFDTSKLLALVRRALEGNNVLTVEPDPALPTVEILVNSVRARSSFSAVMFGFMAGDDHIKGDVVVRSPEGSEVQRFAVSASYALGGIAGGSDEARMGWLYETFAKHILEELTTSKPS
jgi:hypothetical protein